MGRVVVIGGGVTGLAAARELTSGGCEVAVLEATDRWGGKLSRAVIDGVPLDTGAESVLARRPEAVALMDELGLAEHRVHPTGASPRLLVGGELRPLPPSLLGVPTDLERLRPLLSADGFAAAVRAGRLDAPLPEDLPIGTAVDERFGPEVTDRLLEPLLGGVYAGRSRELSFDAVAHDLFTRAQQGGSLLEHARALARPNGTPVFAGLDGGVSTLVDALLADLDTRGVTMTTGATVRDVAPLRDGRFEVSVQTTGSEAVLPADAVLVTAPARATGRLLSTLVPVGPAFSSIPYASVAVITLVVRGLDPATSGLLVPPGELPTVKALTHSSAKWQWVADRAAQAWGPGVTVVRASIGRIGEEPLLQLPDDALLGRTWAELTGLRGAGGIPGWVGASLLASAVTRWGGALPQYRVGHRGLAGIMRDQLSGVPGLAVAGASLDGVGIAACLGSAHRAVTKIMSDLGGDRGGMGDSMPAPRIRPAKESRT